MGQKVAGQAVIPIAEASLARAFEVTEDQIAEHESWCYESMGYPECYSQPQAVDPNRLINADPANRYPLTPHAYRETVQESRE